MAEGREGIEVLRGRGERGSSTKGCVITLVGVVAAIVLLAWMAEHFEWIPTTSDAIEEKADSYAKATGTPTEGEPHLTGSVVVIDVFDESVEAEVTFELPDALVADDPKDVGTIVQLRYRDEVVGEYEDGEDAIQVTVRTTIIDRRTGQQFEGKTFDGPEPPFVKRGNESNSGGRPDPERIAGYLTRLPRQADPGRTTTTVPQAQP